jgi:FkbM family methyltransferase
MTGAVATPFGRLAAPGWGGAIPDMALGTWEGLETGVVHALARDRVFWDLGAHVGWYSLVAAHAGASFIGAVEASPRTFAATIRTVQPLERARALHAAIAKAGTPAGTVDFFEGEGPYGDLHSSMTPVYGDFTRTTVSVVTLDDLLTTHAWPAPDLVKIDVEGGETWVVPELVERFAGKADIIAEVNYEACAAAGAFPYDFLDRLLSTSVGVLVIEERTGRLRRLGSPKDVRNGENVVAASARSLDVLRSKFGGF